MFEISAWDLEGTTQVLGHSQEVQKIRNVNAKATFVHF